MDGDREVCEIEDRSHQFCFFAHFVREILHYEACVSGFARIFQANTTTVQQTSLRDPEDLAKLGCDAAVDGESEAAIIVSLPE
jgi:2-methylisocitrate lyase-like PEP mutase family enzyme